MSTRRAASAALLMILLAACGGDSGDDEGSSAVVCDRNAVTGCAVYAVYLESRTSLSDALAAASEHLVLAVFREDPVCVISDDWVKAGNGEHELSWFSYVDARAIEQRRRNGPGSPPITGLDVSEAYWAHFVAEWSAVVADDGPVVAVVVHAPIDATVESLAIPGAKELVAIDSYRTDTTDERFPGELYVVGHAVPPELGGPAVEMPCSP